MCRNLTAPASLALVLVLSAAAPALAGPATAPAADAKTPPAAPRKADPAARAAADRLDPLSRAAFWAGEVQADPTDAVAGVKLAASLRTLGRYDEAANAAGAVLVVKPDDLDALLEVGRARIAQGQAFYGIAPLEKAQGLAPGDWRPPSLLAVAYGETKREAESRDAYARALKLSPDNPQVLSNLALSLATRGETAEAERLLRRAATLPGAGAQERQNLALVLGYEGKLAEAETLIRKDLPPEVADQNIAYLKSIAAAR